MAGCCPCGSSWFTGFHIEHIKTGDIRWQDIRRKLYPAERTAQRGRHSRYQSGFPHSRHIFNEHVSGTQQSGQQQLIVSSFPIITDRCCCGYFVSREVGPRKSLQNYLFQAQRQAAGHEIYLICLFRKHLIQPAENIRKQAPQPIRRHQSGAAFVGYDHQRGSPTGRQAVRKRETSSRICCSSRPISSNGTRS